MFLTKDNDVLQVGGNKLPCGKNKTQQKPVTRKSDDLKQYCGNADERPP